MGLMSDEQSSKYEIPLFLGFNQAKKSNSLLSGDTINAQNMVIDDGNLQVSPGYTKYVNASLPAGIKTLMSFFRNNSGYAMFTSVTKFLIAATDDNIYQYVNNAWVVIKTDIQSGRYEFLNYQTGTDDLIICGNGVDDPLKWDGNLAFFIALTGNPPRFRSCCLNYERIWATGESANPDRVYYSNTLDPEDWSNAVPTGNDNPISPDNNILIVYLLMLGVNAPSYEFMLEIAIFLRTQLPYKNANGGWARCIDCGGGLIGLTYDILRDIKTWVTTLKATNPVIMVGGTLTADPTDHDNNPLVNWSQVNPQIMTGGTSKNIASYLVAVNGTYVLNPNNVIFWGATTGIDGLLFDTTSSYAQGTWIDGILNGSYGPNSTISNIIQHTITCKKLNNVEVTTTAITENGAGFLELPTWDGGICIGIATVQDEVVIFKTRNIFRITGTYPGEFKKYTVYTTVGAIAERSIVNDKAQVFFLTSDGIYVYDGTNVTRISDPVKDVIASMNPAYASLATAVYFNQKYIVSFPTGSSTVNNTIIEYSTVNLNFIVKQGINVNTFLEYDGNLLFANDNLISGKSYVYNYNTGVDFDGTSISAFWETPDSDWNAPNGNKICSYVYFTGKGVSVQIDAVFNNNGVIVTVTKVVTLTATDKVYKVRIRNKGRRFKFRFSNIAGGYFKITNPKVLMDVDLD